MKKALQLFLTLAFLIGLCACGPDDHTAGPQVDGDVDSSVQYIRTNGYVSGAVFPRVVVIRSCGELTQYYEDNRETFYLERGQVVPTIGFLDACDKYDTAFFEKKILVMVLMQEPSGSIRHELTDLVWSPDTESTNIIIDRIVPEVCSDDMAQWHILIELDSVWQDKLEKVCVNAVPCPVSTVDPDEPAKGPTDPTIGGDYAAQTNFGFAYEHTDGTPARGQRITIETTLTNISGQPYTYTGAYSAFHAGARLYCVADGTEYVVPHEPIAVTDDIGTHTIESGESRTQTYVFNIPADAPGGRYHLQLGYGQESETFYGVFSLVCPEDENIFQVMRFSFDYKLAEQAYKKGESIGVRVEMTNISDHTHGYRVEDFAFDPWPTLYCEVNGAEYVIPVDFYVLDDWAGGYDELKAGGTISIPFWFKIPGDAPSGQYHLRITYAETVEGTLYSVGDTFYNIFTL